MVQGLQILFFFYENIKFIYESIQCFAKNVRVASKSKNIRVDSSDTAA